MQHEPTTKNCWAPEIVYDAARRCFLIFWASTIPGRFPETHLGGKNDNNHRIYATTTRDFTNFTPTELFFEPGFNVIDSTLIEKDGKTFMIFKDETKHPEPMKNLRLATAATPAGPFTVVEEPITPKGSWFEGPSAITVGEYTYLYFDAYMKHHYAALRSKNLKDWEDVSGRLVMPKGIRHGTAFAVPGDVVRRLMTGLKPVSDRGGK
jgi:beta-xylosidase